VAYYSDLAKKYKMLFDTTLLKNNLTDDKFLHHKLQLILFTVCKDSASVQLLHSTHD